MYHPPRRLTLPPLRRNLPAAKSPGTLCPLNRARCIIRLDNSPVITQRSIVPTHRQLAILTVILVIAAFLRIYKCTETSLWMDELDSIELAMGNRTAHDFFPDAVIRYDHPDPLSLSSAAPWWHIWNQVQITTHPPLYFVVLRWWIDAFGARPAAVRSLSILFSLAGIIIFFDLCRLIHGVPPALIAACIMALAVGQIDIAQEARSYPLLIFLGLTSCDCVVRIKKRGATPRRLFYLMIFLVALLLTHYFSVGAFVGLMIYAATRVAGRDCKRVLGVFLLAAVGAAAAWGPQFLRQMRTVPNLDPSYTREDLPNHALQIMLRASDLPLKYLCGDTFSDRFSQTIHLAVAAMVVALILLSRRRSDLFLWTLWGLGIILSVVALDAAHHSILLQITRYTILASPALMAILAAARWPRWHLLPLIVIFLLTALAVVRECSEIPAKQDFRHLSLIIDSYAAPDELLVFYNDSGWVAPGVWYIGYEYYLPDSRRPWMTLRHPPSAILLHSLQSREAFWLIGRTPDVDGPNLFPGFRPELVWHTTAGGVCLMRKSNSAHSIR